MASLTNSTIEALLELRLCEIPKEWSDQVWESDFCEHCELPEVLLADITGKKFYCATFMTVLRLVHQWSECDPEKQTLGFWAVLGENGMSHHSLVALLYAFIDSCDKHSRIGFELQSSILAANIYLVINEIPGSGAYKIFHPLLFHKAVDVLQCWPQKGNAKGKRKPARNASQASSQRRKARRINGRNAANDVGSEDEDEGSEEDEDDYHGHDFDGLFDKEKMEKEIKNAMFQLILDLTKYVESKSLKDSKETLEHVISLFVDLTSVEPVVVNEFDLDTNSVAVNEHKSLTKMAYKALEFLCSSLHGDAGRNMRTVFKYLISNILSTYKSSSAPSTSTIPQEKQLVKDNTVKFVCYLFCKQGQEAMPAVRVLIQNLCMKVPGQAEYRNSVGKAIATILSCFSSGNLASVLEWITKYSKNSKIGYRVFAMDLILQLLTSPNSPAVSAMTESDEVEERPERVRISHLDLLQLIVSRCSDKAPTVRAKALTHFAQCICAANHDVIETVKKLLKMPVVNGAMESHSTPLPIPGMEASPDHTVAAMIRRRVSDGKVLVRKAALQVLESTIRLNAGDLDKKDLETLHDRTMDPALSVRKQAMASITALLVENPDSPMLHSIWLEALLPLVGDRETTAQEKCLQTLEEIILQNVMQENRSRHNDGQTLAWKLLEVIAGPSGQDLRHCFQKVCVHWAKQGKFSAAKVKAIMSHCKTANGLAAWMLLADVSAFKPKLDHKVIVECWNEYMSTGAEQQDLLCYVLKVIENLAADIPVSSKEDLIEKLQAQLSSYKCNTEVIVSSMNALFKVKEESHRNGLSKGRTSVNVRIYQLCESLPQGNEMVDRWCLDLLKASESYLSSVVLNPETETVIDEDAIVKHLFTIGEVGLICPRNTNKRLYLVVQTMIITPHEENGLGATTPVSLQRSLSPTVKAHAFITLGKLCLQNETLAKECIAALTKELETSEDPAVRNNITVVLCDLCVRYTNLVDRYIPNIARGLKDSEPLVRRQTLTLLTHLLQQDYVKWKGSLFFRFVTALVDEDVQVRKFADFSLVHLLLVRHPGMFHQHFIESIFHFNGYDQHKVYNQFPQTEKEKELFSLKGRSKTNARMSIYKFLLDHITDEQRFELTRKVCQEVLGGFVDEIIPLNEESKIILKDALAILCSKNIKLSSTRVNAADDLADDGNEAGAAMANAKNKFLTRLVKKNMIENIVPIIIELKNMLEKQRSPLLKDLMLCLKEIMKDYRSEVQDVLSADRQLGKEIEFDLRKFEEEQKELEKQEREKAKNLVPASRADVKAVSSPNRSTSSRPLPAVATPTTGEDFVTPQLRSPGGTNLASSADGVPARIPCTPKATGAQGKRLQSLATTALLNSARKAIDTAKKVALERSIQQSSATIKNVETARKDASGSERISERENVSPVAVKKENDGNAQQPSGKAKATEKGETSGLHRAASTPEGDRTHMSRISFCINSTANTAPLSPIINLVPVGIRNAKGKKKTTVVKKEGATDMLCMPSPEQPPPKPRTWNISSPCPPQRPNRKSLRSQANDSIANRTRSSRK